MPTYQYACTECGHTFDQVQSFSDDSLTTCPECQGRLRKLFNAVGVVFKGSGFYRNDSRTPESSSSSTSSSDSTSETKTETKSEKKSDATSGAKSDAKPAAKSAAKSAAKPAASSTSTS